MTKCLCPLELCTVSMAPLSATSTKIFSLRAVARRLKEILVEVEAKQFWLRAQFVPESAGNASAGHLYCSLVDHNENGKVAARTYSYPPASRATTIRTGSISHPLASRWR